MSVIAVALRELMAAGVTGDALVTAIERIEAAHMATMPTVPTKSKGAVRTERWRARKAEEASQSVTERHETSPNVTERHTVTSAPPIPPSLSPEPPISPPLTPPTLDADANSSPKAKRGSRLPDDWQPDDADRAFAVAHGLNPEEIDRGAFEFRNYWTSRAGREALKLSWPRTWQNRVIELADRKRQRGQAMASRPAQRPGGGQGVTDFAAIIARRRGEGGNPDDVPGERGAIPGSFRVVSAGERA